MPENPIKDRVLEDARNKAFSATRLPKSVRERFDVKVEAGFIKLTNKKKAANNPDGEKSSS